MSIDSAGDVGGVAPQGPQGVGKTEQQKQDDQIAIRVFAMLMSVLGANSQMIFSSLMPQLAQEELWQNTASGVQNVFTKSPSQITNTEINQFAQGWEFIAWAYAHQGSKQWKDMPASLQAWTKKLMTDPNVSPLLKTLYQDVLKLQQLENQKPPNQNAIKAQKKVVDTQITNIQNLANSPDSKVKIDFQALLSDTGTVQREMSGIATITYARAMSVVYTITSLSKYISTMIQHLNQIKQKIDTAPLS